MIKIISSSTDYKGSNKKTFMNDNELTKLVSEIMQLKENIITFNIRLKEDYNPSYNNPVIEFLILESKYNYNKNNIKNYDELLFDNIRNEFKRWYY